MDALRKVFEAFKAILGFFEIFASEIMASLGFNKDDENADA